MGWLLAEQSNVALEGLALFAICLAFVGGSVARDRAGLATNGVVAVFWRDAGNLAWAWAAGTGLTLAGSFTEVRGLNMPILLLVELLVGAFLAAVTRYRWRREGLAGLAAPTTVSSNPQRRIISTTWEAGLLGAAVGAFAAYAVTLAHVWGHPIHWVIAAIGGALGYAMGLALATPRYSIKAR